jgi:hypothetical protein
VAELKEYVVTIGGIEHTVQLSAEDAKRYGDQAVEAKGGTAENKSRKPANKADSASEK